MLIPVVLIFAGISLIVSLVHLLALGKSSIIPVWLRVCEFMAVCFSPLIYLLEMDLGEANDCCSDSAVFSPPHRASIYVLIFLCMAAYFMLSYKKSIYPPLLELILLALLVLGFILNIFIGIQSVDVVYWLMGNVPVGAFLLSQLIIRHKMLREELLTLQDKNDKTQFEFIKKILLSPLWVKYPIILAVCAPIISLLIGVLYLLGQKPDAIVRAFTETYKHGFSEWDYLCDNVACGGHYLCSVAAKGHKDIVKPLRLGKRQGKLIMCNRQLLIANAFEQLIEEKLPRLHKFIRHNYNQVGNRIHRYYTIFNIKWIADMVYIIMKPVEWGFLLVLYLFDQRPESRINRQYI